MEAGDSDSDDTCGDEETQTISLDEESDDDSDAEGDSECESDEDTVTKRKSPALAVPKKKAKINPDADGSVPSTSTANTTKKVTATQCIMVCNKRKSYTTYPAYLFDVPPNDLAIDNLRRQYLIAEIERSKKQNLFYDNAISFMGFAKETVRSIVESNGFSLTRPSQQSQNEHCYSMPADDTQSN